MELEEIFQTADGCTMAHFYGRKIRSFDPKKLTVVQSQMISLPGIEIVATIIGESHFLMVNVNGRTKFVELLACVNPLKLGFHPNFCNPLKGKRRVSACHTSRTLSFKAEAVIHEKNDDRELYAPCETGHTMLLEYIFPGGIGPRTVVRVYLDNNGVIWINSLHEYSTEDGLIEPLVSTSTVIIPALMAKVRRFQERT